MRKKDRKWVILGIVAVAILCLIYFPILNLGYYTYTSCSAYNGKCSGSASSSATCPSTSYPVIRPADYYMVCWKITLSDGKVWKPSSYSKSYTVSPSNGWCPSFYCKEVGDYICCICDYPVLNCTVYSNYPTTVTFSFNPTITFTPPECSPEGATRNRVCDGVYRLKYEKCVNGVWQTVYENCPSGTFCKSGENRCVPKCSTGWICKDSYTKCYRDEFCSLSNCETCQYGCRDGECVTSITPKLQCFANIVEYDDASKSWKTIVQNVNTLEVNTYFDIWCYLTDDQDQPLTNIKIDLVIDGQVIDTQYTSQGWVHFPSIVGENFEPYKAGVFPFETTKTITAVSEYYTPYKSVNFTKTITITGPSTPPPTPDIFSMIWDTLSSIWQAIVNFINSLFNW